MTTEEQRARAIQKYLYLRNEGFTIAVAAKRAGYTYRTLVRWMEEMSVVDTSK